MYIRFMALATLTTSIAFGAFIREDKLASQSSLPSSSSAPIAEIPDSMIRLRRDNLTYAHAAAYVKWPQKSFLNLDAGECSMIVQTNIDEHNKSDVFNLRTIPQTIVNSLPKEMSAWISRTDKIFPSIGETEALCKNILTSMIGMLNQRLVMEGSSRGVVTTNIQQRVTAFAIALAYKGKTYRAQAQWDTVSDTLVPFLAMEKIQVETAVVSLCIEESTGVPIIPILYYQTKAIQDKKKARAK